MRNRDWLRSELTSQEQRITNSARIDLGAGYPHLNLPPWLEAAVIDQSEFQEIYGFSPAFPSDNVAHVQDELLKAACQLLGIGPEHAENSFVTFAGSVALDRIIASVAQPGRQVITTSPSIDIISGMLSERRDVETIFVPTTPSFDLDLDRLRDSLTADTECIILTSPENPTGNVITEEQLLSIAKLALDRDITLVVDQCFALIDPQNYGIPLLPNLAPPGLRWAFLWDTGKTFGLNEEKLGLIICAPDEELKNRIGERLNMLQFDISRRIKYMFRRIFRDSYANNYPQFLSSKIATNISLTTDMLEASSVELVKPDAGSFLLLDTASSSINASSPAERLLTEKSLGVIRVDSFFNPAPPPDQVDRYLRLAMAREQDVAEAAASRIVDLLNSIGG